MTFPQEDNLSMIYSVRNNCEKYQPTWTTVAAFAATYNAFVSRISLIEQNRDAQMLDITGITIEKKQQASIDG